MGKDKDKGRDPAWQPQEMPPVITKPMVVGWVVAIVATAMAMWLRSQGASPVYIFAGFAVASLAFGVILILWLKAQQKR